MATIIKLKDERTWECYKASDGLVKASGAEREYIIYSDQGASVVGASESFSYQGLPQPGDAHPAFNNLCVDTVSFKEGAVGERVRLLATVKYVERGTDPEECTKWGWSAGTESIELTTDRSADKKPVLNSVGDPFESVPQVQAFAPTFSKTLRTTTRKAWMTYNQTVNAAAMTIGSWSCAAHTLLCSVSEERLLDDPKFKYEYQIQLKYKSNKVKLSSGTSTETELGWDVAIANTGFRAKFSDGAGGEVIKFIEKPTTTGKPARVTKPVALDASGYPKSDTDPDRMIYLKFQSYADGTFPADFTSEPGVQQQNQQQEGAGGGGNTDTDGE